MLEQVCVNTCSHPLGFAMQHFIAKTHQTLRAVCVLQKAEVWESAQAMARILFETEINALYFIRMYDDDSSATLERYLDSIILKEHELIMSQTDDDMAATQIQKANARIRAKYSQTTFNALLHHGFSGKSMWKKAVALGQEHMYKLVYVDYSRNIHALDHLELLSSRNPEAEDIKILTERNIRSAFVSISSATAVLDISNSRLSCGFERDIAILMLALDEIPIPRLAKND